MLLIEREPAIRFFILVEKFSIKVLREREREKILSAADASTASLVAKSFASGALSGFTNTLTAAVLPRFLAAKNEDWFMYAGSHRRDKCFTGCLLECKAKVAAEGMYAECGAVAKVQQV